MRRSPRLVLAGFACFGLTFTACSGTQDAAQSANSAESDTGGASTSPPADSGEGDDSDSTESAAATGEPGQDDGAEPELGGLPGSILLRDDFGQIVVVPPTGSDPITLSVAGSDHTQPTWSSTGERIAWSSFGPDGGSLSVADRNGENAASLSVTSPAFYLSWSEADAWIGGLRPTPTGMEMFIADGQARSEQFVSDSQPFYFAWADDDALVAAAGSQIVVDITPGDSVTRFARTLERPLGAFQAPALLPNGDVLAALNVDGANTLSRISGNTDESIATANSPFLIAASPNGQEVAVLVPATAAQEAESQEIAFQFDEPVQLDTGVVAVIDLVTGEVTEIQGVGVVSMSWSPDGETLALLRAAGSRLEWRFARDGTITVGASFEPSQRFLRSYLPFFDQYNLSSTPWAPDSSAVTFAGEIDDESGVFVDLVDDELGAARIADGEIAFWSPN